MFLISIITLISVICIYYYEMPTHHCPFCILHQDYGYVGYAIYLTLLVAAVSGLGIGFIMRFQRNQSLNEMLPRIQRKLALISLLFCVTFVLIVGCGILFSNLSLAAY